jgi:hypothetical protein
MRFLSTAAEIEKAYRQLLERHDCISMAVAWASCGTAAYQALRGRTRKIDRLIVGTHFFQTDPNFIAAYRTHPKVRFVKKTDGVFHPKIYLFESGGDWAAIIGSANFTAGGLGPNQEAAMVVEASDDAGRDIRRKLNAALKRYWGLAGHFTPEELETYRVLRKRAKAQLADAGGVFGKRKRGHLPIQTEMLAWTWPQFLRLIQDKTDRSIEGRLRVLQEARKLFQAKPHFKDMTTPQRQGIGGVLDDPKIGWGWFGRMTGALAFRNRINQNSIHLSRALDEIPPHSPVRKEQYLAYIAHFRRAYPKGRDGLATATRLLAMKRPDTFVCIDKENRRGITKALGIVQPGKDYENYWDAVIRQIQASQWWDCPRPSGWAGKIWDNRAAFLDAIFYEGDD